MYQFNIALLYFFRTNIAALILKVQNLFTTGMHFTLSPPTNVIPIEKRTQIRIDFRQCNKFYQGYKVIAHCLVV